MAKNGVSASEVATIKAEVDGLRREIAAISGQITGLVQTINERSKTPWATIISAMGVTLAVVVYGGGLAKEPIDDAIARIETVIAGIVPRGEHERLWENFDNRHNDQQRQIEDLKEAVGGIYGARDVIQEMRDDIKRLQSQLADRDRP